MTLEEAKSYVYDELDFKSNRQVKYYERDKATVTDIWNILDGHFLYKKGDEFYLDLINYMKENNKL